MYSLFIFVCAESWLLGELFSSCSEQGLLSSWGAWASHCHGFSYCRARTLGHAGFSSWGSHTLEHRLNSCSPWAELLCRVWDLPGSEIKPLSSPLAEGFFTTEPPGKPLSFAFKINLKNICLLNGGFNSIILVFNTHLVKFMPTHYFIICISQYSLV